MINRKAQEILDIVKNLPPQVVVTYGDISQKIYSHPRAGQRVGQVITKAEKRGDKFPWWRVVDKDLKPTSQPAGARQHLEAEGVRFNNGSVDPQHRKPQLIHK